MTIKRNTLKEDRWQHLAEFFLELETFQIKFEEKIKTHLGQSNFFFFSEARVVL